MTRISVGLSMVLAAFSLPVAAQDVGSQSSAIVDGELGGLDAVVLLQNYESGGLCTGSLIAERVVLTAKHCVQEPFAEGPAQPRNIVVGIGDSIRNVTHVLRPQTVTATPGMYTETSRGGLDNSLIGSDVAVIVLQEGVSGIEPLPIRRAPHTDLRGQTITAIGYGQTPEGRSGVKYTTTGVVTGTDTDLILVGAITCQGDSGGPAITAEGEVAGVVSFGAGQCGTGYGAYNAITNYFDLIDEALTSAGSCLNDGDERCDGADNDCDELVDETCTALGEACELNAECLGETCRETRDGQVCTATCDPLRPGFGCGPGLYCQRQGGCEGLCVKLEDEGDAAVGEACERDADCASLYCADPGDGVVRCLAPCRSGDAMCLAGEACAAPGGACGGCVDEAILIGSRGLGERCELDDDCANDMCLEDGGLDYCTRACEADADCPDTFHCRGDVCAIGRRGDVGEPCVENGDCVEGAFCASRREEDWCTRRCEDMECPEGFDCVEAGGVMLCAPVLVLLGDPCTSDDECVTGVCEGGDEDSPGYCSRLCSADVPCTGGLECRRAEDADESVCLTPEAPPIEGGCSVGARGGAARGSTAPWLALAGLALVFRRRH